MKYETVQLRFQVCSAQTCRLYRSHTQVSYVISMQVMGVNHPLYFEFRPRCPYLRSDCEPKCTWLHGRSNSWQVRCEVPTHWRVIAWLHGGAEVTRWPDGKHWHIVCSVILFSAVHICHLPFLSWKYVAN